MSSPENNKAFLGSRELSVYRCICYFDVFQYPLKSKEILEFSDMALTESELSLAIKELINLDLVKNSGDYFYLSGVDPHNINKRNVATSRFSNKKRTIKKYASLIARFPFVESVAISGSCSKGLLEKDGDVDYFIITSPNKLWLCRTLLVAFKKIFLLNSKKYFCVNYFLSTNNLVIPDHNRFVACEISTLMPVSNQALFETFLSQNTWISTFLPNRLGYDASFLLERKPKKYFAGLLEKVFGGKLGDFLDKQFFRYTLSVWEKKFSDFNKDEFDLNLRSRKDVSKHHPRGFQKKVLNEFEIRMGKIKGLTY